MPDRVITGWTILTDSTMWLLFAISGLGAVAKVFTEEGPVNWRTLAAEVILAAIGAVGIYAFASVRGYGGAEMILAAALMSAGGIHYFQRGVQVFQAIGRGR